MSVARTARRRKQAAMGHRGLEQIYGKKATPHYPGKLSREKSARLLAKRIATERRIGSKSKK